MGNPEIRSENIDIDKDREVSDLFDKNKQQTLAVPPDLKEEGDAESVKSKENADKVMEIQLHNQEIEKSILEKTQKLSTENKDIPFSKELVEIEKYKAQNLHQLENKYPGILGSLFLRKITSEAETDASLNPIKRPDIYGNSKPENINQSYKQGDKFFVDFKENPQAEMQVGAGDLLPPNVRTIIVKTTDEEEIMCTRSSRPRPGYYNAENEYIPVFTGDQIIIPKENQAKNFAKSQGFSNFDGKIFNSDQKDLDKIKKEETESRSAFILMLKNPPAGDDDFDASPLDSSKDGVEVNQSLTEDAFLQMPKIQEICMNFGLEKMDQAIVFGIMKAIGSQESRGAGSRQYVIENTRTGASGKYQIMPANWGYWSKETFGRVVMKEPMSQEIVAFRKMAEYYNKYSNILPSTEDKVMVVASMWYGNMRSPYVRGGQLNLSRRRPSPNEPSPYEYAHQVLGRFDKINRTTKKENPFVA